MREVDDVAEESHESDQEGLFVLGHSQCLVAGGVERGRIDRLMEGVDVVADPLEEARPRDEAAFAGSSTLVALVIEQGVGLAGALRSGRHGGEHVEQRPLMAWLANVDSPRKETGRAVVGSHPEGQSRSGRPRQSNAIRSNSASMSYLR